MCLFGGGMLNNPFGDWDCCKLNLKKVPLQKF